MADWSVTYPLNIAPLGTNIEDGFTNHVNEIAKMYGHLNDLRDLNAGTVAPSSPNTNELWLDINSTPAQLKQYSGGTWVGVSGLHSSTHDFGGADELDLSGYNILSLTGGNMTGAINEKLVATTIAVATTCDIASATGNVVLITGTGTINSFGTAQAGTRRTLKFDDVVTITRNTTSMIVPGPVNLVTATGDTAIFISIGTAKWECINFQKAAVSPIPNTDQDLAGNSNQYVPTQNAVRTFVLANRPTVATVVDKKNAGTNGGTATSGSWIKRTLNTIVTNGVGLTLSSDRITLLAGTYYVNINSAFGKFVSDCKLRLYNISDSATEIVGMNSFIEDSAGSAHLSGIITITASKIFELQYRVGSTNADDGLGMAASFGEDEIYTVVDIIKVA